MNTLYEKDLAAWVHQQIEYIKNKEFDKIDIENFIDEVEGVVRGDKRSIQSYFIVIIAHLLKWEYQPSMRSGSWISSIENSQCEINAIIKDSPSLKNYKKLAFDQAWERARKIAITDTGLPSNNFPRVCPWSESEVMNKTFDRLK